MAGPEPSEIYCAAAMCFDETYLNTFLKDTEKTSAVINLTTNFLKKGLVDEIKIFKTNKNLGTHGKDNFRKNMKFLKRKKYIKEKVNLFGDQLTTYILK